MTSDLEPRFWLLIQGRLTAAEVQQLHHRIASDPDAARLYAEVKLQSELVESAAATHRRVGYREIGSLGRRNGRSLLASGNGSLARALRRVTLMLALGLLALTVWTFLRPNSPFASRTTQAWEQRLLRESLAIQITAPTDPARHDLPVDFADGAGPRILVSTRSLDGQPRSARLFFRILGDGQRPLRQDTLTTDAAGQGAIDLTAWPGETPRILEVTSLGDRPAKLHATWPSSELQVDVACRRSLAAGDRSVTIVADVHDPDGTRRAAELRVRTVDPPPGSISAEDPNPLRLATRFTLTNVASVRRALRQNFLERQTRCSDQLAHAGLTIVLLGGLVLLLQSLLGLLAWQGPRRFWIPITIITSVCLIAGICCCTARVTRTGNLVIGPLQRKPSPPLAATLDDDQETQDTLEWDPASKSESQSQPGDDPRHSASKPRASQVSRYQSDESGHAEIPLDLRDPAADIWVLIEARAGERTGRSLLHLE